MVFDQAKFEAIHFSRKKQFPNPEIVLLPATTANVEEIPRIIKPVTKKGSMRWLGFYFDPRLSFSDHAAKMASKGWKAAAGLVERYDGYDGKVAWLLSFLMYLGGGDVLLYTKMSCNI